jgi:hypothetical protein
MDYVKLSALLARIQGCTFASLDTRTEPARGIFKLTEGEQILLFTNRSGESGYEAMVKRRLSEAGKNPDGFTVGDLPWGERVGGTPFIYHHGQHYLQTIILRDGIVTGEMGGEELTREELLAMFPSKVLATADYQGLNVKDAVRVRTYKLESIVCIRALGEVLS